MKKIMLIFLLTSFIAYGQSGRNAFLLGMFDNSGVSYTPDQVEYYNVKGDGVTDDYDALVTAITARCGTTLTFTAGKTYLISAPLKLCANSTYQVDGTVKLKGGDSTLLVTDWLYLKDSFTVADASKFKVGQYVGITQDAETKSWTGVTLYAYSSGNLLKYGWVDRIRAISGNKIFLDSALSYVDTVEVSKNARMGQVNSVFVLEDVDNVTIQGSGTIDCNGFSTNQVMIHPVYSISDYGENTKAGVGIAIQNCKNIVISGVSYASPLNIINGVTHNITSTAQPPALSSAKSEDVRISYVNLNKARMKNLWVRETDTVTVNVAVCDSAIREDAIVGYTNVKVMTVDSAFITNWGRHGLLFNGNSGGVCDSMNATNIFIDSSLSTSVSAITLKGTRAWVNGATISGTGSGSKRIAVTNQYTGTNNINFYNVTMNSVTDTSLVSIKGDIGRVNFNNLVLNNCVGVAVRIDTFAVGSASANSTYDGCPDTITFTGGGVYGLTGYNFKYAQAINTDSTKLIFSNFFTDPSIYGLTATARAGTGRYAAVDLTWSDSTASPNYVIYRGLTNTPTDSIAGTTSKTYIDSTLTPPGSIYYYRIRGRAANNSTYTAYCTVASDTLFEFETLRWISALTKSETDAVRLGINKWVRQTKDSLTTTEGFAVDSLAEIYDLVYPYAVSDSQNAKTDLVRGVRKGVVMDTLAFVALEGWTGDVTGGNNYMNTNYTPSTDSDNFTRYSNGLGIYVMTNPGTNTNGSTEASTLTSGGAGFRLGVRNSVSAVLLKDMTSSNSDAYGTVSDSRGYWAIDRASNTGYEFYKNGVSQGTTTATTVIEMASLTTPMVTHAHNVNGTMIANGYSPKQISWFVIRKSLSANGNRAESNNTEVYFDGIGKGVIP